MPWLFRLWVINNDGLVNVFFLLSVQMFRTAVVEHCVMSAIMACCVACSTGTRWNCAWSSTFQWRKNSWKNSLRPRRWKSGMPRNGTRSWKVSAKCAWFSGSITSPPRSSLSAATESRSTDWTICSMSHSTQTKSFFSANLLAWYWKKEFISHANHTDTYIGTEITVHTSPQIPSSVFTHPSSVSFPWHPFPRTIYQGICPLAMQSQYPTNTAHNI